MSAYEVTVGDHGAKDIVVDLSCETCGDQFVLMPRAMLLMMVGLHLFCPICFEDTSTCVSRVVEVDA